MRGEWQDIGHGVRVRPAYYPDVIEDLAGQLGGFDYTHLCLGQETEDYVPVLGPGELWTVEKLDPLTLSPSLLCRRCGHHGFIRDGRWVPA